MVDNCEAEFDRVKRATDRVDLAWENRNQAPDELRDALADLAEAGQVLAECWTRERG
jgi:hypothetical protein